jgi:hypothetical protein
MLTLVRILTDVKEMSLERLEIFSIVKTMLELSFFIGNSNS